MAIHIIILQLYLFLGCGLPLALSTQMLDLYWNATSPMFRIDNTDHIIDVNAGNHPWEYDQVNLVCPVYKPGSDENSQEKYIIYSVSKQEYDSCRITQANPRIVAVCNQPHNLMYFTITFRSFTPTPGGLEFIPGHSYYFISTSSKMDLHRRVGGACSSKNMRLVFKVAPDSESAKDSRENIILSNKKLDGFTKIAKYTKHQQPNPIKVDYQRKKLTKESKKKLRDHFKAQSHNVDGGPHTVLYYPWREMIQEKSGYFSSEQIVNDNENSADKFRFSKIVQKSLSSNANSNIQKDILLANLNILLQMLCLYWFTQLYI